MKHIYVSWVLISICVLGISFRNGPKDKNPVGKDGLIARSVANLQSFSANLLPSDLKELTFSAWLTLNNASEDVYIISKNDIGVHGDARMQFAVKEHGNFLSFGINCGGNYAECRAVIAPEELCDGKPHLVAASFDGQFMRVYLDGNEIGGFERQAALSTLYDYMPNRVNYWGEIVSGRYEKVDSLGIEASPFYIGSVDGKKRFKGQLEDVRFYNRALDEQQIKGLFSARVQAGSTRMDATIKEISKYYEKSSSFLETLFAIDKKLSVHNHNLTLIESVALQRLLRADYPEDVNDYILKWHKSPVNNLCLTEKERRLRMEKLAILSFEYIPLTDMQWQVLSQSDRIKWEQVKRMQDQFVRVNGDYRASMDKDLLIPILYGMEDVTEMRPDKGETVAPYIKPETPPTVNRSQTEAEKVIQDDWLFQCDNKPTVARIIDEIKWTRALASRLGLEKGEEMEKLSNMEARLMIRPMDTEDKALYFAVRSLKRDLMFRNPAIDFESVIYIDNPYPAGSESYHETKHRLGYSAVPGGRLIVQKGLNPGGKITKLMPQEPLHGAFWRPDLSYDGKKVVFAFKPHNEKTFHLYEIGIDGKDLRQLTGGIFDDFDPIYMPDGKNIMFLTTRGHIYVRCMPPTNAFVMACMPLDTKPGDKNLYILSRSGEPEYTPSVMDDGRVIYTRWEYTDKPLWRAQSLWTMRQNGTMVQTFWGNQSVWPDLLKDARQIPGSERVMFTGSAHHDWFSGCIGILDPTKGLNFPHGLTKVTQEITWPECGNGPVDPKENTTYHISGKYDAYYSPYPLSEKDFLVSARRNGKYVLMLMDTDGNREIINEGFHNIWDAIPVRSRKTPVVTSDLVEWPTWEERYDPKPGIMYSNNVYEGAPEELRNKAKYLRVWSIEHKTYTDWWKRNYASSGPEISMVQSEGVKKIIGTVPIESDGSVKFYAPSGIALHFQLLDAEHRALQTMKSFTGVQPTEQRGCLGCHESHSATQQIRGMGKALKVEPKEIEAVPWDDISVSYERYVQPALDRYCAKCHADPDSKAYKRFNSTLRPGFIGFKEPYVTLLGNPTWANPHRTPDEMPGGFGWAGVYMVEAFSTVDSLAYQTPPAMTSLSYKSKLVEVFASGKHYGVKADQESLMRVILWVDAMGPYFGSEELDEREDPRFPGKGWLPQQPRVKTAPVVPRPGPFDPFYTDEAYDVPNPGCRNKLPLGVAR